MIDNVLSLVVHVYVYMYKDFRSYTMWVILSILCNMWVHNTSQYYTSIRTTV